MDRNTFKEDTGVTGPCISKFTLEHFYVYN